MKQDRRHVLSWLALSLSIAASLVLLETAIMAVLNQAPPNQASSPVLGQLGMLQVLWAQSPWATVSFASSQPLLVISHVTSHQESWGLYFYPFSAAGHILVGAVAGAALIQPDLPSWRRISALTGATVLLTLAVTHVRTASCCSAPAWAVDVALRVIYDPIKVVEMGEPSIYRTVYRFMDLLQGGCAALGIVLLALSLATRRPCSKRHRRRHRTRPGPSDPYPSSGSHPA